MHPLGVAHFVFAQSSGNALPFEQLAAQARAHFAGTLTLVTKEPRTRVSYEAHGARADFVISIRPFLGEDEEAARAAESGAPGTGLADLAARCRTIWTVEMDVGPEWLMLELCALLASVALGPLLLADGSALLGVRGARERARILRGAPSLTR